MQIAFPSSSHPENSGEAERGKEIFFLQSYLESNRPYLLSVHGPSESNTSLNQKMWWLKFTFNIGCRHFSTPFLRFFSSVKNLLFIHLLYDKLTPSATYACADGKVNQEYQETLKNKFWSLGKLYGVQRNGNRATNPPRSWEVMGGKAKEICLGSQIFSDGCN